MIRKLLITIIIFSICLMGGGQALGQALTKGEAIERISAMDFVRQKIGNLLSFAVGYDESKVNRANLVPVINYVKAVPKRMPPDGRTVLELTASVDDPAGLQNISGVRADLSNIGRLPNMMLVDNGLWGDEKAGDGIYTLQSNVNPSIDEGEKEIQVAVANNNGWLALSKTTVNVRKNPVFLDYKTVPRPLMADGSTKFQLWVRVENPGGPEDIQEMTADLSGLGLGIKSFAHSQEEYFYIEEILPSNVRGGRYKVPIQAKNLIGGQAETNIDLEVK